MFSFYRPLLRPGTFYQEKHFPVPARSEAEMNRRLGVPRVQSLWGTEAF